MTEPVYCKDCEYYEQCNAWYILPWYGKSIADDEPCEDFKPREGEGE